MILELIKTAVCILILAALSYITAILCLAF